MPVRQEPNAGDAAQSALEGFGFSSEKESGQGEDAPPLLLSREGVLLVGVFDGMGGAGGRKYTVEGAPRSGAYLASRAAAQAVVELVDSGWLGQSDNVDEQATQLKQAISGHLKQVASQLDQPESRVRSRLSRLLPTTVALAIARNSADQEGWSIDCFWAGDSRIYLLDPSTGLSQLTMDDTSGGADALADLTSDAQLTNFANADSEFEINVQQVQTNLPFVLMACTDGCFSYMRTPMHFENTLWSTLMNSKSLEDWKTNLKGHLVSLAGDDVSMALTIFGVDREELSKRAFQRSRHVDEDLVQPIDEASRRVSQIEESLSTARDELRDAISTKWEEYRTDYEVRLQANLKNDLGESR